MIRLNSFLLSQKLSRRGFLVLATKTGITQIKCLQISPLSTLSVSSHLSLSHTTGLVSNLQAYLLLPGDGEHPNGRGCLHSLEVAPNSRVPRRSSVDWTQGTDQGAHLSSSLLLADAVARKFPGLGMTGSQSAPFPGHSCQPRGLGSPQSESSHRQGLGEGRHPGLAAVQSSPSAGFGRGSWL